MSTDLYTKLREKIDSGGLGFPATESGIEMKILRYLFTNEEAEMYLQLSHDLDPVEAIAKRSGRSIAETDAILKRMTQKGVTFPRRHQERIFYAAAPFMHGIFENAVWLKEDRELSELLEAYMNSGFEANGKSLRTVPVNTSLQDQKSVLPFDDVVKIVESKDKIAIIPCACARHMKTLDQDCDRSMEVCMAFDFYAEYTVEGLGVGRWINQEEAKAILEASSREGLVHQAGGSSRNAECICNCCPDCCNGLKIIKRSLKPARLVGANYHAQLSADDCTLCEECIERCPMDALTLDGDAISFQIDRCIGCGLCASDCPSGSIVMVQKAPERLKGPPAPEKYGFMKSSIDFDEDLKRWESKPL